MDQWPNIRTKTVKLFEENIDVKFHALKAQATELDTLYFIRNCASEDTIKTVKTTHRMENVFWKSVKVLNLKYVKNFYNSIINR